MKIKTYNNLIFYSASVIWIFLNLTPKKFTCLTTKCTSLGQSDMTFFARQIDFWSDQQFGEHW